MEFGVNIQAIIPCRSEPSHRAELVTQILFGEHFEITQDQGEWCRIRNSFDGYKGWIDSQQILPFSPAETPGDGKDQMRCGDAIAYVTNTKGQRFAIPCGSVLPNYNEGALEISGNRYEFEGRVARHDVDSIVRHARRFLNAPYLWGGKSAFGIDCSGFTQVVFACAGLNLLRDASQQVTQGQPIESLSASQTNDLAFFESESGKITHVGIVIGNSEIIHASGKVRIDTLDEKGILRSESETYTHKLHSIRRINRESR